MSRIRTIKPEFWSDEKLANDLSRDQRMFYAGLWNEADDEGRFIASNRRLIGAIFPYDEDLDETFSEHSLRLLAATDRLVLYEVEGCRYGQLTKFLKHQRINRPSPSKIPAPPNDLADSVSPHGVLTDGSPPEQGTGNREQGAPKRRAPRARKHALPDTWRPNESHTSKASELNLNLASEAEGFRLHAKANGRLQLDWDASFHTWLRKSKGFARPSMNGHGKAPPRTAPVGEGSAARYVL